MARTEIFTIGLNNEQYVKAAQDTQAEIIRLNEAQKKMKGTSAETSAAFVQNSVALKENKSQLNELHKQISSNNAQSVKFTEVEKNVNKELGKSALSINELRAQNRKLLKVKNDLILTSPKELALAKQIDAQLNTNNATIKENSDAYTQQKLNIGNYQSALSGISPGLARAVTGGQALVTNLRAQKAGLAATSSGLKLFRIALISTGIGAIVVALGAMIGLFLKTQRAVDGLTRVFTPLKEVFQTFIGILEKGGEALFDMFNNPKKTILELKESIKQNISNRIEGLIETFGILGDVIKKALSFDFQGASDAAAGLGEAVSKSATGVENFGEKVTTVFNKFGDKMTEALDRGKEIANLGILVEKQEIALVEKRAENLRIIREQELIAKDRGKTDAQRQAALDEALRLTKEIQAAEVEVLNNKIKQKELQQEANDTDREEQMELAELKAQVSESADKATKTELRFLGTKNKLATDAAKQAIAAEKERLDSAVEALDLELALYMETNRAKLEADGELSQAIVDAKVTTLEMINQKELAALDFKLENGLIKEGEYNLAKLTLENDFQAAKKETLDALAEQEAEELQAKKDKEREARATEFELQLQENKLRRATEREIKLEEEAINFEADLEVLNQQLLDKELSLEEHNRRKEILEGEYAKNVTKINEDSAKATAKITQLKEKAKTDAIKQTFNNVSELLGKESGLGKAAAVAGTSMDTYESAVAAYKGMVKALPGPAGVAAGIAAAALSVSTGLATIKKIVAVKEVQPQRAAKGMLVGPSHHSGGINIEAEGGEAILNKRSMADPFLRALASDINQAGGGVRFADGGIIGQSSINSLINSGASSLEQINELVDRKINAIRVINNASETAEVAQDAQEVRNFADI